ncbi:BMP family ABC transporter substrate-binding protein [Nocardioides sp. TF02-7]|uniref:BMP family lipoprotein n=1 Tax=Nocardioides sp. TF02-7 TaxID=2917724 RepID=UPI001F05D22B|nr:BMP family ABC transporter substrate-binding protein [Nocardioides sp. TF02-7]UMG93317.1 BMP family ABC transporter substrate-binding protein [Nocardioides sp. TF02-7]
MRKGSRIAALAAAASLALVGCATEDDGGDSGSDDNTTAAAEGCVAPDGDIQVGLAYDVGGRGDQSFNDSAYAGLERAQEELGVSATEAEASDGEAESAREERLRTMAESGMNPIIGVGFAYSESTNVVAPEFPDTCFGVIDGFDPDEEPNPNVAYLGFAEEQGSFLVGVAAALKTESDTVGFVGGVHNDLIKKFEAGYTAGVQAVNPDIEVIVNYIEESDLAGFADPAGGKEAAAAAYDQGADVVYHASGGSGSGVFEAATEADAWAIGVDSDQYLTAPKNQQQHILTSMLKRVDVATFDMIQSVADGEPLSSYQVYDLSVDGVAYSTSGGFVEDIASDIDGYGEQIVNGEIEVPTAPAG